MGNNKNHFGGKHLNKMKRNESKYQFEKNKIKTALTIEEIWKIQTEMQNKKDNNIGNKINLCNNTTPDTTKIKTLKFDIIQSKIRFNYAPHCNAAHCDKIAIVSITIPNYLINNNDIKQILK